MTLDCKILWDVEHIRLCAYGLCEWGVRGRWSGESDGRGVEAMVGGGGEFNAQEYDSFLAATRI